MILRDRDGKVFDSSHESYELDCAPTTWVRAIVRKYATRDIDIAYIDEVAVMLSEYYGSYCDAPLSPLSIYHCYGVYLRPFVCGLVASHALPAEALYELDQLLAQKLGIQNNEVFFTFNRDTETSVYCHYDRRFMRTADKRFMTADTAVYFSADDIPF